MTASFIVSTSRIIWSVNRPAASGVLLWPARSSATAPCEVHPECHLHLYDGTVTSQPAGYRDQHDLIHLGGETAVVVPVDEYRRLRALEHRASADDLDAAEADAVLQQHDEWVAAGRPGALSHEEVMAELLGGSR